MKTGRLTEDSVEFDYEIRSVNINDNRLMVMYTPTDPDMTPIEISVNFYEDRRDAVMDSETGQLIESEKTFEEHLTHCLKMAAPCTPWRAQKLLLENIESIT